MKPNKLQHYRNKADISQAALAKALSKKVKRWNYNPMTISNYENVSDPDIFIANSLIDILNDYIDCTLDDVFPYKLQLKWEKQK